MSNSKSFKEGIFSSLQGVDFEDDARRMSSSEEELLTKSIRKGSLSPDATVVLVYGKHFPGPDFLHWKWEKFTYSIHFVKIADQHFPDCNLIGIINIKRCAIDEAD